jgi:hypothetical protein
LIIITTGYILAIRGIVMGSGGGYVGGIMRVLVIEVIDMGIVDFHGDRAEHVPVFTGGWA